MRTSVLKIFMLATVSGLASAAAPEVDTQPQAKAAAPSELPRLVLDARLGGLFPSLFNELDTTFTVHAGVALQFAFARALGVFMDLSYCEPTATGSRNDPRLVVNGGDEKWQLAVRDLGVALGARAQFHLGSIFDGYLGVGPQLSFTRTVTSAVAGDTALGTHTEYSTRLGGLFRAGAGLKVGPGAIVLEVALAVTPVDHLITGDANTSGLSAQLGYAFYVR